MRRELNLRQQRFVDAYLIDPNATQAAITAGYAPQYAGTNADKLLKNTKIAALIAGVKKRVGDKLEITLERQVGELERLKQKSEDAQDYGNARLCVDSQSKHVGLLTDKIDARVKTEHSFASLTDAELRRIEQAALRRITEPPETERPPSGDCPSC